MQLTGDLVGMPTLSEVGSEFLGGCLKLDQTELYPIKQRHAISQCRQSAFYGQCK
jgi:hypothetical protein